MSWYSRKQVYDGVFRISEPFGDIEPRVGVKTVNMYVVVGGARAALIDTGMGIGDLASEVAEITALPIIVLNTHYHWDHVGANSQFQSVWIHGEELELVRTSPDVSDLREAMSSQLAQKILPSGIRPESFEILPAPEVQSVSDDQVIDLGDRTLRVLHTPGHSPGHICLLEEGAGILFSGDTAYKGPVFACFKLSDPESLRWNVRKLAQLPGISLICPGHNELISNSSWLGELADGVEAAVSGQKSSAFRDDFIVGEECQFEDFSVWLPSKHLER